MDFAPALAAAQEGGLPVYNKSAAAVVTAQLARRVTARAHVVACRAKARVTVRYGPVTGVERRFSRRGGGVIMDFSRGWPKYFFRSGSSGQISFCQLETKRKTFFY